MIDWQQVTLNLRRHYKPLYQIAKELNSSYDTIKELSIGRATNPRFDLGMKLLDMHLDKCPQLHRVERIGRP